MSDSSTNAYCDNIESTVVLLQAGKTKSGSSSVQKAPWKA